METNISVSETRYIKINVFLCLGDQILVSTAPEFRRKLAQTCAGGDQYLVSRAQFCSDDREAASRTDWLPGSRLAVWPSMQVADLTGVLPQYVIDFVVEHFDDLNLIVLFVANSLLSIVQHSEEKEINMINRLCSPENYS